MLFVIIKMYVINSLIIGGGCMPKTTLQVIQAIEDEAKKIAEQSYWDIDTIISISTDRNAI